MINMVVDARELLIEVRDYIDRSKNWKPVLDAFGAFGLGQVAKKFKLQGYPEKWDELKDKTIEARFLSGNKGRKIKRRLAGTRWRKFYAGAKILQDSGRLFNSILPSSKRNLTELGTNVIYAAVHNFGFKKKKIPARPYLFFLDEDIDKFSDLVLKWISEGRI